MRIKGRELKGPNIELLVIPRPPTKDPEGNEISNDIPFMARAILDYSDFDKLCPAPVPPISQKPGGQAFQNIEHPEYKKAQTIWGNKRINWMILKSLEATDGLEWDRVNLEDSDTWNLYTEELKESGFNSVEINYIIDLVFKANSLNEDRLEQARVRFLAGQALPKK